MALVVNLAYVAAAVLFIIGLKMLSSPRTARMGNVISAFGMLIAVVFTLLQREIVDFKWIGVGLFVGSIIGFFAARLVAMTAMPQMVGLLNGFGGLASLLVGWAVYHMNPQIGVYQTVTIFLSVLIGGVTFSGSFIAYAKLAEIMGGKPILYRGQRFFNVLILAGTIAAGVLFGLDPAAGYLYFLIVVVLSLLYGVLFAIPIGGADMPVAISLLNAFSGMAACAAGFVIMNNVLIVAGALVGASGIILTNIMCKAMNRSLSNVLFSGFGAEVKGPSTEKAGEVMPIGVEDASLILEAARSVALVPGYGLAVAQAQHAVRKLGQLLETHGAEVRYAIHPVAGRMPGHMNVLLAEAEVPYEQLVEMEVINPMMATVDVVLVIGANDVVNPAAREEEGSPLYGMPIINVDEAKTVIVLKRSLNPGFAGVDNPLFYKKNTRMLFGDAKATVLALVAEFKRFV
jgi:NAD(P) transhydrogenase subunit beta